MMQKKHKSFLFQASNFSELSKQDISLARFSQVILKEPCSDMDSKSDMGCLHANVFLFSSWVQPTKLWIPSFLFLQCCVYSIGVTATRMLVQTGTEIRGNVIQ